MAFVDSRYYGSESAVILSHHFGEVRLAIAAKQQKQAVAGGGPADIGASAPPSVLATHGAGSVASAILLSRIAGLLRESIFAHYLGNSAAADAFKAGFRIPNILQNLFGEGVLSASFIPVYSKLLGDGEEETADLLACGFGALLGLAIAVLVLIGVLAAPWLIDAIAPGFSGDKRELTIAIVRILFPGAGLLVMSAWCLGVLNSHHRFFASYAAPVAWNAALIATLLWFGRRTTHDGLAIDLAWGSVAGAGLQVLVQLPQALALLTRIRLRFSSIATPLRTVFSNLLPVIMGRGVGQVSSYVDNLLASLLPTGAVAALNYGQTFFMLPTSLFGVSVAAAELPTLSRVTGSAEQVGAILRARINAGLRQIAFLVVPSAAAFFLLGDVIAALVYQSGEFTHANALYVWAVLAGYGVGLLATTMVRLYISAFYALLDATTPFRFALVRVTLTLALGWFAALLLPHMLGIDRKWGVAGLSATSGMAAWIEFTLLRWRLNQRVGWTGLDRAFLTKLWTIALGAAGVAFALKQFEAGHGPRAVGLTVLPLYGLLYLGGAYVLRIPEVKRVGGMIRRRFDRPV
ncbi:MAG TPA: murein biosynthesis integral membrane protein MurJ [Candidatus Binataceae bacterium]|nr:murein biosynthesis integral membrane protein MurJ [Candidatus Binataceae bacterium]